MTRNKRPQKTLRGAKGVHGPRANDKKGSTKKT